MEPMYVMAKAVLKPWALAWFRWEVADVSAIPRTGPAIVAFNHIAYLDAIAALYVIDRAGRRSRFLAKAELFDDWKLGWLLRSTRQIPVRRGTRAAPDALDRALEMLRAGEVIAVFPEGSADTSAALEVRPPKTGAARLALATGAPIVPVGLWGTQNVWPKDAPKRWWPRQRILAAVGDPILPSGDASSPDDVRRLGAEMMGAIAKLVDDLRPRLPDRRKRPGLDSVTAVAPGGE